MPRLLRMLPVLLCLWPALALGQTQSASAKDAEPSKQTGKPCVSTDTAQEVLRRGRSLGYADDEIVEAYGENACATLAYLRREAQQKAQPTFISQPTSTEQALKTGFVKCQTGANEVSVWLAPGNLTVVASPGCGESLDVLQDGELWMRVRTEAGVVGYIPRSAVADSLASAKAKQVAPSTAPSAQEQSHPATPTKKQHAFRDALLAALGGAAGGALGPTQREDIERERLERLRRAYPSASLSSTYVGVGGGHWVSEVSDGGTIVTLEDGSLWEISALDRVDTALWLPTTSITVLESRSPVGNYKYILINKDDGEKALAKYLGNE